MTRTLVWLNDDLRADDNLALHEAIRRGGGVHVIRIQPEARGRPRRTVNRRRLEEAAEAELERRLSVFGVGFESLGPGDDTSIASACRQRACPSVVRNAAEGTPLEEAYKAEAEEDLERAGILLTVVNGETVRRAGPGGAPAERPHLSAQPVADMDSPIGRLRRFLTDLPTRGYRDGMWRPATDQLASSHLSTDLAAGTLAGDRAMRETLKAERDWLAANPDGAGSLEARSFRSFAARLTWRAGFIEAFSGARERPPLRISPWDADRLKRWREGRTGVPMADAAMRQLEAEGWINFRLRQTVASYAVQTLSLPAFDVGVALSEMFDDFEPSLTWCQIGLHSGAIGRDRGPRIINPVKQGRELDPHEDYVRTWLPALRGLPPGFAHEPWRHPSNPLGAPMVDHLKEASSARANFPHRPRVVERSARQSNLI